MSYIMENILSFVFAAVSVALMVLIIFWIVPPPNDICDRRVQTLTMQQIVDCTAKLEKEAE
jgi:hypothetical protein